MNIQYIGLIVAAASRAYTFRVIDTPNEIRQFIVKVRSQAFRSTGLKFQDGPGICLARLKRELERETQGSPANPDLYTEEQDVREYLLKQYPRKRSFFAQYAQNTEL